jgi:hypothetical protein
MTGLLRAEKPRRYLYPSLLANLAHDSVALWVPWRNGGRMSQNFAISVLDLDQSGKHLKHAGHRRI